MEEKEVLTDEEIVEEAVSEAIAEKEMDKGEIDNPQDVKNALASFIVAMAGVFFFYGAFITTILGIVSLVLQKKVKGTVEKNPHRVFLKISKPVAIIEIILGILSSIGYVVWLIAVVVLAALAAKESGAL